MTAIRYFDRRDDTSRKTITGMGNQTGPPGGDGWQVISLLRPSQLPAGQYGIFVTGRIANVTRFGSLPSSPTGRIQVCLADSAGLKSPHHFQTLSVSEQLGPDEGIPFAFLVIMSSTPATSDPSWGSSWPGGKELQLIGRGWWASDSPTYGVTFDVTDVQWIWARLSDIPAGDQFATHSGYLTPGTALAALTPFTELHVSPTSVGSQDELWLHLWVAQYMAGPKGIGTTDSVPAFQAGYKTSSTPNVGFVAKNGTTVAGVFPYPRIGVGSHTANFGILGVPRSIGGFWFETRDANSCFPTLRGVDASQGVNATIFRRFACLSIKLDNLPSVYTQQQTLMPGLTDTLANQLTGPLMLPLEVPFQGRSYEPWVLATGTVVGIPGRRTFELWVNTDDLAVQAQPVAGDTAIGPLEGFCHFASGSNGIGASSPAFQYQMRWLDRFFSGVHYDVRDAFLVTFHPIRDPDNEPPTIPSVGAAVAIVPGTEGLAVGSLSDPPSQPDVTIGESGSVTREDLLGATGYRRTWSVFVKMRRAFTLTWSAQSATQRDTVKAFLKANLVFRLRPARAAAQIAVVQTTEISIKQENGPTFRIDVDVAELIYTG